MTEKRRRIHFLDELRGFAIICMIVHHTFLDIGDVLGLDWGYDVFDALCTVQPIFWAIFIVVSGICTRLSRNSAKRGLIVLACAFIITLVTAVFMPLFGFVGAEIYFGILHCLGICMIIVGLTMPLIKKIDFRIGAVVSAVLFFFFYGIDMHHLLFGLIKLPDSIYFTNMLAPIGLHTTSFYSADYFPVVPWIFMFYFGAFVGKPVSEDKLPKFMYTKHSKALSFIGKNSLWVYLIHQPIIYSVMIIVAIIIALRA